MNRPTVFMGLDLGKQRDYTAVAVLQYEIERYVLRRLERLPLGTSYPGVVAHVRELVHKPQLRGCVLVADATGVGGPVIDLLRAASLPCTLAPALITAGSAASEGPDGTWHVPKIVLVSTMQVLLQTRRLVAPEHLPLAE